MSVCSFRYSIANVTINHRHMIAHLIADRWNYTRHRIFQIFDEIFVPLFPAILPRSRSSSIKQRPNVVFNVISVHRNQACKCSFNLLLYNTFKLPLDWSTISVAVDLKKKLEIHKFWQSARSTAIQTAAKVIKDSTHNCQTTLSVQCLKHG